ncbi:MAG: threonine synthase, partial [Raoultibacter sp.]
HDIEPGNALPEDIAKLSGCRLNELIAQETGSDFIPVNLAGLDETEIRFTDIIESAPTDIEQAIVAFLDKR